jgi:outer membrane protein
MQVPIFAALILVLLITPKLFAAEDKALELSPLWELGIGGGATYTPDYPGSDQNHLWAIPFPFGVYRGEILHSDRRGGTRARIVKSARFEVNFSAGGGLPSSSSRNDARTGMPDLEFLGEVGPRLMIDLVSYPDVSLLRLGLPVRAAFSTDGRRYTDRGLVFAPELLYDIPHVFGTNVNAFTLLTMNFTDRRFADYFYRVNPEDATPDRRAYEGKGGYLQSDVSFGVVVPLKSSGLKVMAFGSVDSLHGSANRDSPLFRAPLAYSASMVIIWVFAKSDKQVATED